MPRKIEPVSLQLRYEHDFGAVAADLGDSFVAFVNIADGLSLQNRKLFRRNRVYSVDMVEHQVILSSGVGNLDIQVVPLPATYTVLNALDRAERAWDEMNDQVVEAIDFDESASARETRARWSDFAMDMISEQATYISDGTLASPGAPVANLGAPGTAGATMATVTDQVDASGKPISIGTGEKVTSKFQTPQGEAGVASPNAYDEFYMTCIGDHIGSSGARTSVSALRSYLDTRIDPTDALQEPGLGQVSTDPLVNLFTNLDTFEQIAEDLMVDGDRAPYPDNDQWFMTKVVNQSWLPPSVGSTVIGTSSSPTAIRQTGAFLAPHGWVMLIFTPSVTDLLEFGKLRTTFHITPGTYRGVASEHVGAF